MSSWKYFSPRRIWQQLFAVLTLLVVMPLAILGILLIRTSQEAVRTSVLRDNQEIAVRAAQEIEQVIERPREMLNTTAAVLGVLDMDSWRQETVLVETVLRQPIFKRLAVVGPKGREIVSSELGIPLRERSNEPAFLKGMSGEEYFSQVTFVNNDLPMMTMSTPIIKLNKIVGVLVAEVTLRGMWDIVDGIKIGMTGRASVVSKTGRFISHPDKKRIFQNNGFVVPLDILGKKASWEQPLDSSQRWLVAYAPVLSLDGGLVIVQSAAEAYAFSKVMQAQARILIVCSILATVLISLGLARFISRPINALVQGTRRISRGDFDQKLTVSRKDEIGELLEAFNTMAEKLKDVQRMEKLSVIGKAATTIAHELKNSLTLVHTYIQTLPSRYKDKKFIEDFVCIVPRELDTWKSMLKNMTDYAQVSRFFMGQVDINSLAQEVAVMAKERAAGQKIDFLFTGTGSLPLVRGNKEKLKQVLLNLISNAFEATAPGGKVILSTGLMEPPAGSAYVLARIEDSGKGISPAVLPKVFDPFFTTRSDGLGLGLAISRDIVTHHGGQLDVTSEVGRGTVFTMRLPVRGENVS